MEVIYISYPFSRDIRVPPTKEVTRISSWFRKTLISKASNTLNDPPGNIQLTIDTLVDNLNDGDIGPGNQLESALFAVPIWQCRAKRGAKEAVT